MMDDSQKAAGKLPWVHIFTTWLCIFAGRLCRCIIVADGQTGTESIPMGQTSLLRNDGRIINPFYRIIVQICREMYRDIIRRMLIWWLVWFLRIRILYESRTTTRKRYRKKTFPRLYVLIMDFIYLNAMYVYRTIEVLQIWITDQWEKNTEKDISKICNQPEAKSCIPNLHWQKCTSLPNVYSATSVDHRWQTQTAAALRGATACGTSH